MKKLKILLVIVSIIIVFYVVINVIPSKNVFENNQWRSKEGPLISAHRGGATLNPENTQKAFDYVINDLNYVDIVEIDIRTTADDQYVIIHDETINRVALEEGSAEVKVSEATLSELRNYNYGRNFIDKDGEQPYENYTITEAKDAGLSIMTLEEFLDRFYMNTDFRLFLEIKEKDEVGKKAADYAIELINQDKYQDFQERTLIISFADEVMDYIIEKYEQQEVGPLGYKIIGFLSTKMLGVSLFFNPNYQCIQMQAVQTIGPISIELSKKSYVDEAHEKGMAVTYWTINDRDTMEKIIAIGADVITTNSPDLLYEILVERGLRL